MDRERFESEIEKNSAIDYEPQYNDRSRNASKTNYVKPIQ